MIVAGRDASGRFLVHDARERLPTCVDCAALADAERDAASFLLIALDAPARSYLSAYPADGTNVKAMTALLGAIRALLADGGAEE